MKTAARRRVISFGAGCGIALAGLQMVACQQEGESGNASKVSVETYLLDKPDLERPLGWTRTIDTEVRGEEMVFQVTGGGRTVGGTGEMLNRSQEVVQVLSPARRRVTVQFDKLSMSYALENGSTDYAAQDGPMVRKFVIVEKKNDGTWQASLESGELPTVEIAEELEKIAKEFSEPAEIYGQSPRLVGEEWQVDLSTGDKEKSVLDLRFDRVEDFEGRRCAVLTGTMKSSDESALNGVLTSIAMEVEFTTYRSLEDFVDLKSEGTGTYTMTTSPELGTTLRLEGPIELSETTRISAPGN